MRVLRPLECSTQGFQIVRIQLVLALRISNNKGIKAFTVRNIRREVLRCCNYIEPYSNPADL
ncbi:hypothetical protein SDJN02_09263, partial [Cucurbita argyrosperma subsp. argyrosperma]